MNFYIFNWKYHLVSGYLFCVYVLHFKTLASQYSLLHENKLLKVIINDKILLENMKISILMYTVTVMNIFNFNFVSLIYLKVVIIFKYQSNDIDIGK